MLDHKVDVCTRLTNANIADIAALVPSIWQVLWDGKYRVALASSVVGSLISGTAMLLGGRTDSRRKDHNASACSGAASKMV